MKGKKWLCLCVLGMLPFFANANCDPNEKFDLNACSNNRAPTGQKAANTIGPNERAIIELEEKLKRSREEREEKLKKIPTGQWRFQAETDPMTDEKIYKAILSLSFYQFDKKLVVRCVGKKTEMYINWAYFLGDVEKTKVTHRVDKSTPETLDWYLSTDNTSTFHPDPVPLLKKIANSEVFRVQTAPFRNNPVTYEFATRGADKAFADIRKACHW